MTAEPIDMGDAARRIHEQHQQRKQYDHLFAAERDRLQATIRDLEARNLDLLMQIREAERKVTRLETIADHDARKKERRAKGSGVMKGQRNRVVYDMRWSVDGDAVAVRDAMLRRYSDGTFVVTNAQVIGNDLWLWATHVVVGGCRDDALRRIKRACRDAGAELVADPEIEILSREPVQDDQMPSDGS